jgi:alkanesulfonate monooxygenase SsuD/methylene tetrahydromethanopterin reductase-like flavin-dependent oxidoreductase (luciferase family)
MKFGVFYEHQLPKPWGPNDEERLFHEALEQVELADRLGFDHVWAVEHHFLEEYSHSSAPEVFLAACAARTRNIRIGHGIRQTPPNYNHPARVAEAAATLDLISHGRLDLGIGEGATRLELGGFGIPARDKRAMSIEAGEQIANMMAMTPYPGFEGEFFSMPCRNVIPKPVQKPHPPMWMACTNRTTIELAARLGIGALAFAFVNPDEAKHWVKAYYDIIKSAACVPLGHTVNANIAIVASCSVHEDRAEAIRRGYDGFHFFGYALNALVAHDTVPGYTQLWTEYEALRGDAIEKQAADAERQGDSYTSGLGAPADVKRHIRWLEESGVDEVIVLQQGGRNLHSDICATLELFASEVMPEFQEREAAKAAAKEAELAPYKAAALARKQWMKPLTKEEVPVVRASVKQAQVPTTVD